MPALLLPPPGFYPTTGGRVRGRGAPYDNLDVYGDTALDFWFAMFWENNLRSGHGG
jgi:hypothetical protein